MSETTKVLNEFINEVLKTNNLLVKNIICGYENHSKTIFYYLIELSNHSKRILMFSKHGNDELNTQLLSDYFNDDININLARILDDFDEDFNTSAMEEINDSNYFAINNINSINNPTKIEKEFARYCLNKANINDGYIIRNSISVLYS